MTPIHGYLSLHKLTPDGMDNQSKHSVDIFDQSELEESGMLLLKWTPNMMMTDDRTLQRSPSKEPEPDLVTESSSEMPTEGNKNNNFKANGKPDQYNGDNVSLFGESLEVSF